MGHSKHLWPHLFQRLLKGFKCAETETDFWLIFISRTVCDRPFFILNIYAALTVFTRVEVALGISRPPKMSLCLV